MCKVNKNFDSKLHFFAFSYIYRHKTPLFQKCSLTLCVHFVFFCHDYYQENTFAWVNFRHIL